MLILNIKPMVMTIYQNIVGILLQIRQCLQQLDDMAEALRPLPIEQDEWLDTTDAMREFKITDRTLRRWRSKNEVLWKHVGGKKLYSKMSIDEHLKE